MRQSTADLMDSILLGTTFLRANRARRELDALARARPRDGAEQKHVQQQENRLRLDLHELGGFLQDAREDHPQLAPMIARLLPGNVQAASLEELGQSVRAIGAGAGRALSSIGVDPSQLAQTRLTPEEFQERGDVAVAAQRVEDLRHELRTNPRGLQDPAVRAELADMRAHIQKRVNIGTAGLPGDLVGAVRRELPDPTRDDLSPRELDTVLGNIGSALNLGLTSNAASAHASTQPLSNELQRPSGAGPVERADRQSPGMHFDGAESAAPREQNTGMPERARQDDGDPPLPQWDIIDLGPHTQGPPPDMDTALQELWWANNRAKHAREVRDSNEAAGKANPLEVAFEAAVAGADYVLGGPILSHVRGIVEDERETSRARQNIQNNTDSLHPKDEPYREQVQPYVDDETNKGLQHNRIWQTILMQQQRKAKQ